MEYAKSVQRLVRASQISFSGILPGVLNTYRLVRGSIEARVTVESIVKAEEVLRKIESIEEDAPVVLLGGGGFIGRRVLRRLNNRTVYAIDPALNISDGTEWCKMLHGQPIILLNIASKDSLSEYIKTLWPEVRILNEVYPEPDQSTLQALSNIGCSLYHITGLRALSFPPFPLAYRGGIPCCAGRLSGDMNPVINKLV